MSSLDIAPGPEVAPTGEHHRDRTGTGIGCLSGGCGLASSGDWDSSNPAFAMSRGSSQRVVPDTWTRPLVFWHALVPITFRSPGKPSDPRTSLKFPPAEPVIRQRASWRTSPVRSSPGPVVPGWNGNPWATTPELRTSPLPVTHVRLGTGPRTLTRNYSFDNPNLQEVVHSTRATSCRTVALPMSRHPSGRPPRPGGRRSWSYRPADVNDENRRGGEVFGAGGPF